jgi:hypothetical protein
VLFECETISQVHDDPLNKSLGSNRRLVTLLLVSKRRCVTCRILVKMDERAKFLYTILLTEMGQANFGEKLITVHLYPRPASMLQVLF